MVLTPECSIQFGQEVAQLAASIEEVIPDFHTREEALAFSLGTISSLALLTSELLSRDDAAPLIDFLDEQLQNIIRISGRLPQMMRIIGRP